MTIETAPLEKATVQLDQDVAAAVERQREAVARMTGCRPSVSLVLRGALKRAMQAGLLGELPERAA